MRRCFRAAALPVEKQVFRQKIPPDHFMIRLGPVCCSARLVRRTFADRNVCFRRRMSAENTDRSLFAVRTAAATYLCLQSDEAVLPRRLIE